VPLVGAVGLKLGGDSASDDSLLSREGDSRKLFDDARGDGLGRKERNHPSMAKELDQKLVMSHVYFGAVVPA
jgi:hypothetical protein